MHPDYIATARVLDGFTSDAMQELQPFLAFVSKEPLHSIGLVFEYQFASVADDPWCSLVLFTVYGATRFLGLILKRNDNIWPECV